MAAGNLLDKKPWIIYPIDNAATLVVNAYQSGNEEGLYANKIDPNTLKTIITAMCVRELL